jgi:GLPGLI family protein
MVIFRLIYSMINMKITIVSILCSLFCLQGFAQKRVSDLTIVYDAVITTGAVEPKLADAFDGATTTVYLKGSLSRSEMLSALASFTTIHDARSGTAVVLQEVGGQKVLIRMTADDWKDKNRRYEGISFKTTGETKQLAGYDCKKAVATLKDGSTFTVYYTEDLIPENNHYNSQFTNLRGLPLEYELQQGKLTIKYVVSQVSLNPVPVSKFDIPKSGYREMSYEESKNGRRN